MDPPGPRSAWWGSTAPGWPRRPGPPRAPPPFTILSSLFLHGSLPHLAGNMWFLWVFGRGVEAALGGARFLLFYLGAGVLAAVAQVAMTPGSQIPMVGGPGGVAGG